MLSVVQQATCLALMGSLLTTLTSATALTYKLAPNERACFFANVQQAGAKIAFYFAVRQYHDTTMLEALQWLMRLTGSIWWFIRHRLQRYGSREQNSHGKLERATTGLGLHSQGSWRIPILLQQ